MADDPNRDLLPVKEGSCIDTCRSSIVDSRDRHAVCKLDRYQLEDRYLRMLDEIIELKKLSNTQEDKIKRLVTKLMRVSATPRSCLPTTFDFHNDKNRHDSLELENAKLKDKITVLRSQILNHKIVGRSPSRNRRLQLCTSSGPTTCRSDIGRMRSSTSHLIRENDRDNERDAKNYIAKIEELELEKKDLTSRIEDLEIQIATHEAGNQRKKVAENVEFIRVWRQMKMQNEQLVTSQARNASLEEQNRDLKQQIDEKTRNNKEITSALLAEKKKFAEIDEELAIAKNSQLTLREKDERIRDMANEMKILQQHNAELIALSSKYNHTEMENCELRKKISEQLSDNRSLESAFTNERANIAALQTANERLMEKLAELQSNIDTLTIQLKSKNERDRSASERRALRTMDRQTSTNSLPEKIVSSSEKESRRATTNREVQTENEDFKKPENSGSEIIAKKSPTHIPVQSPMRTFQHDNGNLTPEEMINLLEKAQINTPLEAQNVSRMRRIESSCTKNLENTSDSRQSFLPDTKKSCQSLANDLWQILLVLGNILRENVTNNSLKIHDDENSCPNDNDPIVERFISNYRDENNNKKVSPNRTGINRRKMENNNFARRKSVNHPESFDIKKKTGGLSMENFFEENFENSAIINSKNMVNKYTETSDCYCENNEICNDQVDCGYACCQSVSVSESVGSEEKFDKSRQCDMPRNSFDSFVCDIGTSIQKTFDNIHKSRIPRHDDKPFESYKSWKRPCESRISINGTSNEDSNIAVCRKTRCNFPGKKSEKSEKQIKVLRVKKNIDTSNKCIDEQNLFKVLSCTSDCNNNCDNGKIVRKIGSCPMLITNDQGILEIHITSLQLTSMGTGIFSAKKNVQDLSLFVTWDIWNYETAFTPSLKYPKFNFNTSSIYRLSSLFEFFDWILAQSISFKIYVSRFDDKSCSVAIAYLSIKDILVYPQNRLHYVANFSSILPFSSNEDIGQLSLWIRLSCDLEKVELFMKRRNISHSSLISNEILNNESKKIDIDAKTIYRKSPDSRVMEKSSSKEITLNEFKISDSGEYPKSDNSEMGKDIFESLQMDSKNVSSMLETPMISPTLKNSGLHRFTPEASSSILKRPEVNGQLTNNASTVDSYLTISVEPSTVKRSDSSIIRAMENEDTTSEELHHEKQKPHTESPNKLLPEEDKSKENDNKLETASVREFNNLIHNSTILSPSESRSSIQDLGTVFSHDNWQKYRRRSMATQAKSSRPSIVPAQAYGSSKTSDLFSYHSTSNSEAVIMRIESLSLFKKCPLLDDSEIHRLYVEFEFLGYRGVELETISIPKPTYNTNAYFNYMRKFEIDEEGHTTQRDIIRAMMTDDIDPTIKFILVSEPLLEEMETKECVEVGYAYFNIREHILRGRLKDVSLTIMNAEETESIGILKITLLGAEAIRRCMSDL